MGYITIRNQWYAGVFGCVEISVNGIFD
ncbi:hypothetical protein KAOT1_06387 [Kordia algicida OT-1]|uniref:Uncharacterized protein n=1 Tax=Kordia algicida OT-1 TaxID=391587 RepID=A9ED71_9FLAO|nr:hypothetical protein KAOT1_06387 [Kordia algicida OT-1]